MASSSSTFPPERLLLARLRQLVVPASQQPADRESSLFFHSSCDVAQKVRVRVDGLAPGWREALSRSLRGGAEGGANGEALLGSSSSSPAALRVRATLLGFFGGSEENEGQELCPAAETPPFDAADGEYESFDAAPLTFPVAYSDLPADAVVSFELQLLSAFPPSASSPSSSSPPSSSKDDSLRAVVVAAGRQRLFSRHGALKTGPREVDLLPVVAAGERTKQRRRRQRRRQHPPSSSSSSDPSSSPSSLRLLHLRARRLARGDLGRTPWLDGQSLAAAARELCSSFSCGGGKGGALAAEAVAALAEAAAFSPPSPSSPLPPFPPPRLSISLPSFGRPVLFDDPSPVSSDARATASASSSSSSRAAAAEGALSRAAADAELAALSSASLSSFDQQQQRRRPRLRPLFDPEAGLDSPAELKASLLAARAGGGGDRGEGEKKSGGKKSDRSARPDAAERAAIDSLLWQPPGRPLAAADRALLWRFRWFLASDSSSSDGRALALVLRAAGSMPGGRGGGGGKGSSEVSQLIAASKAASTAASSSPSPSAAAAGGPSSSTATAGGNSSNSSGGNLIQGALALLGPELAALPAARERAAEILSQASEEELELYLLFLVQALRFERGGGGSGAVGGEGGKEGKNDGDGSGSSGSSLADVLVSRAAASPRLALALHWHLVVEFADPEFGARAAALHSRLQAELRARANAAPSSSSSLSSSSSRKALAAASAMAEQVSFVARVRELAEGLAGTRTAAAKGEKLRAALLAKAKAGTKAKGSSAAVDGLVVVAPSSSSSASSSSSSSPRLLLSPVDPSAALVRVDPERCAVFKSALAPLLLSFDSVAVPLGSDDEHGGLASAPAAVASAREAIAAAVEKQQRGSSSEGGGAGGGLLSHLHHPHSEQSPPRPQPLPRPKLDRSDLIYKRGDDLRQDALVLALLRVADAALKREGLDLRLTPYAVLPTSPTDGFIELVRDAPPLSAVLQNYRTVSAYLRSVSPNPGSPGGISPRTMDTYSRSLAGWAALTYALGVGDRHADNVLICRDGRVCHVDFGFILGRDPRPWGAPPLRLARELLEPLGWGGGGGGGLGGGMSSAPATAAVTAAREGGLQQQLQQQAPGPASAPPPPPQLPQQQQPSSSSSSSEAYDRFLALACEAFGVLRSASAAPSLVGALHLARVPANAVLFVSDRLRPGDRDGEAAARALADAIAEGAAALVPALLEKTHRWAQSWR